LSTYAFDSNILIDALIDHGPALDEIRRATAGGGIAWISRMVWMQVMSKGSGAKLLAAESFLSAFSVDELTADVASRAAALRRERSRLRSPDAVILASAQLHGRTLVTRNTRDFPVQLPGVRIPYIL
jgi:hypothetical protein